jgi:hypothetical protein
MTADFEPPFAYKWSVREVPLHSCSRAITTNNEGASSVLPCKEPLKAETAPSWNAGLFRIRAFHRSTHSLPCLANVNMTLPIYTPECILPSIGATITASSVAGPPESALKW